MINDTDWQSFVKHLEVDEGFRAFPYDDLTGQPVHAPQGKITIGIGLNLEAGIDYQEAVYLALNRMKRIDKELLFRLPFYDRLDNVRRYVLINIVFNVGINGFMKFKRLIDAMACGNYESASDEIMDSNAARQLPARYNRLATMMQIGKLFK